MSVLSAAAVERLLAAHEEERGPGAWLLEAGCGRWKHFAYPPTMRLAGLDISAEQLAHNDWAERKIRADVQEYRCAEAAYGAVVSIFVLEHLDRPEAALRNMLDCLLPGGLLVLAVPNFNSLKGIVTRATPFWFHELFYRWVYRRPGSIFPTLMRRAIAPARLRAFFRAAGCEIVHEEFAPERLRPPFSWAFGLLAGASRVATLGRWRPERSNWLVVARKLAAAPYPCDPAGDKKGGRA